jgi:hypothetical protein
MNPYLKHFQQEVLPHLINTRSVVVILPNDTIDSKLCLEVGAAVVMDKPILVVTRARTLVSSALEKIAAKIAVVEEEDWTTESAKEKIAAAVKSMMDSIISV